MQRGKIIRKCDPRTMATGENGGSKSDSAVSVEVAIGNGKGRRRRRRRKAISEGSRYATRRQSRERFPSDLGDMLREREEQGTRGNVTRQLVSRAEPESGMNGRRDAGRAGGRGRGRRDGITEIAAARRCTHPMGQTKGRCMMAVVVIGTAEKRLHHRHCMTRGMALRHAINNIQQIPPSRRGKEGESKTRNASI